MEKALLRLQTLRVDTHRQLAEHFKAKVQLKEQMDDNEWRLHFCRGVIAGLDEMEKVITESLAPAPTIPSEDFEGQAMDKPDKVKFPDYKDEDGLPSEYKDGAFQGKPGLPIVQ